VGGRVRVEVVWRSGGRKKERDGRGQSGPLVYIFMGIYIYICVCVCVYLLTQTRIGIPSKGQDKRIDPFTAPPAPQIDRLGVVIHGILPLGEPFVGYVCVCVYVCMYTYIQM
jgi:hypothetical protein